jgi:hypothetical protein
LVLIAGLIDRARRERLAATPNADYGAPGDHGRRLSRNVAVCLDVRSGAVVMASAERGEIWVVKDGDAADLSGEVERVPPVRMCAAQGPIAEARPSAGSIRFDRRQSVVSVARMKQ